MVRATWSLEVVCCEGIGAVYDEAVKLEALNLPYSPYLLSRTWCLVPVVSSNQCSQRQGQQPRARDCRRRPP